MNYADSRDTKENKDFIKKIDESLSDKNIDSTEAKEINEKYKNLKSNTLAITKEELSALAKWLGLEESSSLFKTVNKLKEVSNKIPPIENIDPGFMVNPSNGPWEDIDPEFSPPDNGPWEDIDPGFSPPDNGPWEDIDPGFSPPDNGPIERMKFEIPSETEIQREKNIKRTILQAFWDKWINSNKFWFVWVDFEWNDNEKFLKMVDNLVSTINSKEKEAKVFLKNSVIKNKIKTIIQPLLIWLENEGSWFDDIVDDKEVRRLESVFKNIIDNLLKDSNNFQTYQEDSRIGIGKDWREQQKDPDDNIVVWMWNWNWNWDWEWNWDSNWGSDSDPRRRIKKWEKWPQTAKSKEKITDSKESSKNWITLETVKKVNEKLKELGLPKASKDEIFNTDEQDISLKENNNVDRIIKSILDNREYTKEEKLRKSKWLLDIKEYLDDKEIISNYAHSNNKTYEQIKDAISIIFDEKFQREIGWWDYIKKTDMSKLLKKYFENHI